jgi:hypothetical protein
MQNVIGRHIFHVINAHDLTQHIYNSNFVSEKINVEDKSFYKYLTMGEACARKGASNETSTIGDFKCWWNNTQG